MATQFVSTHQFDDAAIRGNILSAFRVRAENTRPVWRTNSLFEEKNTAKPWEEFTSFSGLGYAPVKEQGAQTAIDTPKQNYTLRVNLETYAIMMPVSEEALEFLKSGNMEIKDAMDKSELLMDALEQTQEILAADVFGNAFDTNFVGMDTVPLVSASHKLGRGGTASNSIGAVAVGQAGIEAALQQGRKMVDDSGIPVGVGSGPRVLLVPEDQVENAKRALMSQFEPGSVNTATMNPIYNEGIKIVGNRYLPDTNDWFLINTGQKNGLFVIWGAKPAIKDFGDDKVGVMFYRARQRVAFAPGLNWRRVQGAQF